MQKKSVFFFGIALLAIWLRPDYSRGQEASTGQLFMQASIDVAHLRLSGPSYDKFVNSDDVLPLNFALYYHLPAGELILEKYGAESALNPSTDPTLLLASTTAQPGPTAPLAKPSFLKNISVRTGLQLIGKGGKYKDGFGTSTTRMTYLEIPVYALYNYSLPDDKGQLFGGLGFYLAAGLWGKSKYTDPTYNQSFSTFDKDLGYKRFDAGLNFMVGYQMPQGLYVSISHELGLANINTDGGADKTRTRVWSLNVGYPLKKLIDKIQKK